MLNPAAILAIIKYVQLGIAAAPEIEKAVIDAKNFISQLFSAKVITADQQNFIHANIDAVAAVFSNGQNIPSSWTVQDDPK